MRVNTHCHFNTFGEDFSLKMVEVYEPFFKSKNWNCWRTGKPWKGKDFCVSAEEVIKDMNRAKVDKVCLIGYVMKPVGAYKPDLIEYIAQAIDKYPNRLIGFVTVDPLGGLKAVQEIEKAVNKFGFKGVKILPAYNYVAINDRRIWPIYEKAQELRIPVLVHTGLSSLPLAKTLDYNNPLLLEDVAIDFPELKLIAAHIGNPWIGETLAMMLRFKNIYTDLANWARVPLFLLAQTLVRAKNDGSINRVLWGSDYPENDFAPEIEVYQKLPRYTVKHELEPFITQEDIDLILGNNAASLLKLT